MTSPTATLVDLLRRRAQNQPNQQAYTFLVDGELEATELTYGELDRQARVIGGLLQRIEAAGERALLLYPPGLAYIAAFFGCLYAGVVAVPAYPPDPARLERTLPRLRAIIADARPAVVLTTAMIRSLAGADPAFQDLRWLATDELAEDQAADWRAPALSGATLALLQYTSGSTAAPKGVLLTHANLLHNSALIHRCFGHSPESRGAIWLPPYHDMGLIGGIIQPLYGGFPVVLMSPLAFLERPLRWLQAVSAYRATTSGGPNFAYDLCVRKTTPEQRAALDLSSWRIAFNGAEPVRLATLERFVAAFEPAGFRREAFYPCYGLAEATLLVSSGQAGAAPSIRSFDQAALGKSQAVEVRGAGRALVGCGQAAPGLELVIARPKTLGRCESGEVGEICVAGPSVARGYWGQPDETAPTFRTHLADGSGPFLRTGDLGFLHDGELFVAGRLKDLIIIRGRNYYPQDIELTVERSHPSLRIGCGAAFAVEREGEDRLVIVQEVARGYQAADLDGVAEAIRRAVTDQHELQVGTVVLLGAGGIPKTSSGKIQRHACRAEFLAGGLDVVGISTLDDVGETSAPEPRDAMQLPNADSLRATSRGFADQVAAEEARDAGSLRATSRGFADQLAALRRIVAKVLDVAPTRIDPDQPISAFGLDSLMAVELQNRVEQDLGAVVPMTRFLQGVSVAELAAQMLNQSVALAARTGRPAQAPPLQPIPRDGPMPLSFAQERLWLLDQLAPGDATFIPVAVRLSGRLDVKALQQSINTIIERHETLRTTFMALDGQPVQLIAPAQRLAVVVLLLIDLLAARRGDLALRLAAEEVQRPFDLARGPLLRVTLLRLDSREHVLLLTMHHIISDGWSMGVLVRELATLYAAATAGAGLGAVSSALPPLPIQYADFAQWQRQWLQNGVRETQLAYWRRSLSGDLPALELPTDRPRPAVQTFRGARRVLVLASPLAAALRELSRQEEATLFMTLLAGFLVILARYTGQRDIVVGTPITGRTHAKIEGLIGFFVNTLVLRTDLSGEPSFRALLGRVRETALGAYAHQDLPFDHLLKELQPERDLSRTPLFQVFFNLLSFPDRQIALPGLTIETLTPPEVGAKYDVTLYAEELADGIQLELVYNADLFTAARMAELLDQLQYLLEQAAAQPQLPYTQFSLITPKARASLPDPRAPLELRWDGAVHERFAEQARWAPERLALEDPHGRWTYAELDARSNQLARYLTAQGIEPHELVAIYAHRSAALVLAVLGVLKAGAAFMILDPAYPPARLIDRLRLARPRGWLQLAAAGAPSAELDEFLTTLALRCRLTLPRLAGEAAAGPLAEHATGATAIAVAPDDLAYIAFTSGSTGRPKGIIGTHRPLSHFLHWYARTFELSADDQFCMLSGLAHDPLLRDIFAPLWLGATLHIPDPDAIGSARLLDWMRRVSVAHLTPAMGRLVLDSAPAIPAVGPPLLPRLRYALLSGDVLTRRDIARLRQIAPSVTCVNVYGATESPQIAVYYVVPSPEDSAADGLVKEGLPLGRGIADVQLLVLNSAEQVAGVSELGELYIRTPYLAQGYLGNEVLTRARFLPDPFGDCRLQIADCRLAQSAICNLQSAIGTRLYKTGDLGRYLPDGNVEFCGRVDQQVKIRGFRVELEEIEGVLGEHPAVLEAAVSAWDDPTSPSGLHDKQLVAYIVATNDEGRRTKDESVPSSFVVRPSSLIDELRAYLKQELPDFMVPAAFVLLDALPLTPNGKLDRRALPPPDRAAHAPDGFVAPRTASEEVLAHIWAEVLHLNQVGVDDNFFALGGHSLLATQLIARVRETFAVDLPLRSLFEAPTVAELAETIAQCQGTRREKATKLALPRCAPNPAHWYEPFPLTDIQQAYWVGRRGALEIGNVATHSYLEIDTVGLNLARFARVWRRLIDQHGMLRAVVLPDGRQQILERVPPYQIAVLDLRGLAPPQAEARLEDLRQRMSHQVLPSDRWPLFEIRATRLDDRRVRLHIGTDALISDAWSRQILAREFVRLYEDPAAPLAPLELSFRDYVLAEVALRDTKLYQRALAYWHERLASLPPAPELPLAQSPGALKHPRFVRSGASLPAETWSHLKDRATAAGLTPSGVLLAAFAEVLAVWSKNPRFTINLTLFNRLPLHPQAEEIVGDFTSPTLLAVDSTSAGTFVERARRIQEQLWIDLDHRYVSGVHVLRELARMQGGGLRPAMPVVFTSTLRQGGINEGVFALNQLGEIVYGISQTPQVWLDHQVYEHAGTLVFNWDSVDGLFPAGLVQDMFAAYCRLLQCLADDAASWQATARQLVPAAQLARRAAINATAAPVATALLHTLFATQVPQRPDQAAVVAPGRTLTYAELDRRATYVARWLRTLGARPNTLIAVVMEKGWEQVVAVLGILRSGAAYLPIDATTPAERLRYMLEHAAVSLVLTQPWLDTRLAWPDGIQRLCIDDDAPGTDDAPLESLQDPLDLAYVIYTSGSTGRPKGVMIDHRSALNTILDLNRRFAVGPGDRVLALSSLSFDLSVYDIFGLLGAGGTIVMPEAAATRDPARWTHLLEQEGVTIWNSVPALLELLVEYLAGRPTLPAFALRLAFLSGDWIPLGLPDQIRALAEGIAVIGMGGATEAAIWSIIYPIGAVDPTWKSIPYGTPMVNQSFHVLDERLDPRPTWVHGQLYIGGAGLARGYLGRPDLTAERFVPNPFADERRTTNDESSHLVTLSPCHLVIAGTRLYKTGDLGRYLPDGSIEFLGREDFQVKIQGYRIELGEIEAALYQHPAVRSAVVAALAEPRGNKRLVGYVVPATDQRPTANDESELSSFVVRPSSPTGDLRDPRARLRYKLKQPGLRQDQQRPTVQLPRLESTEAALEAEYLRRRSYRTFVQEPIALDQLSALLSCLRPVGIPGAPFPKYRYGSAGSLYPVQTYLYVKPGRVNGLDGGSYYYEPSQHRLVLLADGAMIERGVYTLANRALFDESAFALFLVGQLGALTPLYGENSLRFATLEAGAMAQLLEQSAPDQQIGLCQIGNLDFERIRDLLALDAEHVFLHSLLGGPIAPDQPTRAGFLRAASADAAMLDLVREQGTTNDARCPEGAQTNDERLLTTDDRRLTIDDRMRSEPSSIVHRPSSLTSDLRAFLAERLPAYMVPAAFVLLDALPLSANGKIDRKLLPHPDASQTAPVSAYVAPQPGLEQTIATILQEILLLEKIGTHDNFFDLGGNSLHLVQTHSRIQAALGRDIPLVELFNNPTISSLAHYLNQQRAETPQPPDERTDRLKEGKDRLGRLLKRSPR